MLYLWNIIYTLQLVFVQIISISCSYPIRVICSRGNAKYHFKKMKPTKEELHKTINSLKERIAVLEEQVKNEPENVLKDGLQIEFLSQMSHELRTPVNIMLNAVDMLKEDYIKNPDDYAKEILNILNSAGRRIHRTIDLFANLVQLNTGRYSSDGSYFNLYRDLKDNLFTQMKADAREKDIGFYWTEEGKNHLIETDAYAATQIFMQIVDNAIKFTNIGKVEVLVKNDDGKHSFVVEDTGIGIKEEFIPHVFDAFVQEDTGYSRRFEGNGLGLTIAKQFADRINAKIKVESEKGVGSKFTVTF